MPGVGKFIGGIRFGVTMDTRGVQKGAKRARRQIGAFVGATTRMLGVYGGAAGVVGVLAKAASSYEQLNRSMNRSLSIMGNVSDGMRKKMTAAAIDVASTTTASSKQAADAYFFLASAGLNAEQSLAALPKVAKFAQAGNFDLALATDLLTDAQSALGLTVKDTAQNMKNMQRVSDVLVKANTLANATVQQFSEALTNKAGAALRLVGKDIEEGVAVLAAFADQGVKGAEAGTGFGIVLRDLQTKAIKFSDEFARARVRVFDAGGEMRNMADIIHDLEQRMVGMSDQTKKTFLLDLGFSDKSVAFVQALIGVSDKIREYEQNLRGAAGTTAEVADKMLTPLESAMNRLSAAFDKAAQGMGPLVEKSADLVENFAALLKGGDPRLQGTQFEDDPIAAYVLSVQDNIAEENRREAKRQQAEFRRRREELRQQQENIDKLPGRQIRQNFGALGEGLRRSANPFVDAFRDRPRQEIATDRLAGRAIGGVGDIVGKGLDQIGFGRSFLQNQLANVTGAQDRRTKPFRAGKKLVAGVGSRLLGGLQQTGRAAAEALKGDVLRDVKQSIRLNALNVEESGLRERLAQIRGTQSQGTFGLTQAGSAESFRQQAAAKRRNEENKLRRESRDLLKKIEKNQRRQTVLEPANL